MEYIIVIFMLFFILYVISYLCKQTIEGFNVGGKETVKTRKIPTIGAPPSTCTEFKVSPVNTICANSCKSVYTLDLYYGQDDNNQTLKTNLNVLKPGSIMTEVKNILEKVDKDNTYTISIEPNKKYFGGFYKINCDPDIQKLYTISLQIIGLHGIIRPLTIIPLKNIINT